MAEPDVRVCVSVVGGLCGTCSTSLFVTTADGLSSLSTWVGVPGVVWDGNGFDVGDYGYLGTIPPSPQFWTNTGPDLPVTCRLPGLSRNASAPSSFEFVTADLASPAVGYFDRATGSGLWIIIFEQQARAQPSLQLLGRDSKLLLSASPEKGIIELEAPGVRSRQFGLCSWHDSTDPTGIDSQGVQLRVQIHSLNGVLSIR